MVGYAEFLRDKIGDKETGPFALGETVRGGAFFEQFEQRGLLLGV